ncbi:MAG: 5-oxoprolinase subunit PxpB [Bryobacterales bacterium]|nr:5-oxoprolinase subunit PxpB [Bryobacterales bacterium]
MADILSASDRSLLVVFGNTLSLNHHARVVALWRELDQNPLAGVTSVSPAYASVLVRYDPLRVSANRLEARLRELLKETAEQASAIAGEPRRVELPVCYELSLAPDLEDLAKEAGMSPEAVAGIHCSVTYHVYFLGFAPGFAYMGDVDSRIAAPRHAAPRPQVPEGAVGIAGKQTGVYPRSMPGGWRLIGRCPLRLIDVTADGGLQTVLQPGDAVTFVPISRQQFDAWGKT